MDYKLFLDDERYPTDNSWVIARNFNDAVWYVENWGFPKFISFDHDLSIEHFDDILMKEFIGGTLEKTGYDFAKWLCNYIMDSKLSLPDGFDFYVHSQNFVGAKNINEFMQNFLHNWQLK